MRILEKLYIDGFIVAMLGAVALGWLLPMSGDSGEILSWITKLAIGLLFLMYGARLSTAEVWSGLRNWRLHLTTLALTYVIYPLLGVAFAATFGRFLPSDLAIGIVFLTLVPATVQSCIAYTGIAHGNVPAAVVAASTSSMLGVFLTPLLAAMILTSSSHVRLDARGVVSIVAQLLLPFVVGQLLHFRVGGFMRRNSAILRRADRSFVLLVVFSAFSTGTAAGIWGALSLARFALLIVVSLLLLLIALALTSLSGKLLGFSRADQIVILFVGTSKSITAGLPIAAVLFPGEKTALIIVPLMIYHQVKLIACAVIAQRLSRQAPDQVAEEAAR
jgi:solute carrier family 10 (sodium/bile acid cotransporter), member 7